MPAKTAVEVSDQTLACLRAAAAPLQPRQKVAAAAALERVQQNGLAIAYLTAEQRTPEVCMAAVQQNGRVIEYLTAEQRTPEVIMAAVQQNGRAVAFLTAEERTPEVCMAAVLQNGRAIQYLASADLLQAGAEALKDVLVQRWQELERYLAPSARAEVAAVLLAHAQAAQAHSDAQLRMRS